jgi:hypothetical protein
VFRIPLSLSRAFMGCFIISAGSKSAESSAFVFFLLASSIGFRSAMKLSNSYINDKTSQCADAGISVCDYLVISIAGSTIHWKRWSNILAYARRNKGRRVYRYYVKIDVSLMFCGAT